MTDRIWTIPNILTLSRLPLSVVLFACIAYQCWLAGLIVFGIAALTDWLDGLLARRLNQMSAFGRSVDPLIDKVLTGGAFIYLMPVKGAELSEWMVTVVIGRELLITGVRGIMESRGVKFGADALGKIKMILQCVVLVAILTVLWLRDIPWAAGTIDVLHITQIVLIYAMLLATIASGLQYLVKAGRSWSTTQP
jgi:CDP-diacylglycerol--glycerol-3-phosphate 3-phosphatidyltransferase